MMGWDRMECDTAVRVQCVVDDNDTNLPYTIRDRLLHSSQSIQLLTPS